MNLTQDELLSFTAKMKDLGVSEFDCGLAWVKFFDTGDKPKKVQLLNEYELEDDADARAAAKQAEMKDLLMQSS